MEELSEYRQELLNALEDEIDELSKLVQRIPGNAWHTPIGQYNRTPHYILAHLQALESQVFAIQLHRIVEEHIPLLPLFDENAWMAEGYDPGIPARLIIEEFAVLREQEVAWLCALPVNNWSKSARHPWWGVRTLQWFVELQLDYSRQHLQDLRSS